MADECVTRSRPSALNQRCRLVDSASGISAIRIIKDVPEKHFAHFRLTTPVVITDAPDQVLRKAWTMPRRLCKCPWESSPQIGIGAFDGLLNVTVGLGPCDHLSYLEEPAVIRAVTARLRPLSRRRQTTHSSRRGGRCVGRPA